MPLHCFSYPEWPHRKCVGLAFQWSRVRVSEAAASLAICGQRLHRAIRGVQGVLPCVWLGATANQLYLPSLSPLSVAGYGRLQLGASHWAIAAALLQVVDN